MQLLLVVMVGKNQSGVLGFYTFIFNQNKMSLYSVFSNKIYSSLPGVRRLWHRKGRPEH